VVAYAIKTTDAIMYVLFQFIADVVACAIK